MSLLIVFIIISIPFHECLIVSLTVFQRWSSCWTRVTESEWRRHRMNWSSWFRRRSWRRPRCSSLPTNRYSLTDGHTHTHLHIGRCAQVWWKKTEWGGQGTAGEGTEGRLSAYLCQQTGTVWQMDIHTHTPTHRKVCVGVVKEDRMRWSRYTRRRRWRRPHCSSLPTNRYSLTVDTPTYLQTGRYKVWRREAQNGWVGSE